MFERRTASRSKLLVCGLTLITILAISSWSVRRSFSRAENPPDSRESSERSLFIDALVILIRPDGRVEELASLLKQHPEAANSVFDSEVKYTLLHQAGYVRTRQIRDMVRELIRHGADVDATNQLGDTPLMMASKLGNLPVARELVDAGADVNAYDMGTKDKFPALYLAAQSGHADIVQYLLEHGADVRPQGCALTPLYYACKYMPPDLRTPLAARTNREVIDLLIKAGADINDRGADLDADTEAANGLHGLSPFYAAVRNGWRNGNWAVAIYISSLPEFDVRAPQNPSGSLPLDLLGHVRPKELKPATEQEFQQLRKAIEDRLAKEAMDK